MDTPPPPTEEPPTDAGSVETTTEQSSPEPKTSPIKTDIQESDKPKETPSIFGKKKAKEETTEAAAVADKQANEFSEEDLQRVWKAFGEQKENAGDTERLVLGKAIKKGADHQVILMLGSQLEVSFLEKFDTELVQFLRKELANDHVVIRTEIEEVEEAKKLYTSTDIFDYMVKQNPDLKDLKDRLGLDFDY